MPPRLEDFSAGLRDLLARHAGMALDRHRRFTEIIEGRAYEVDQEAGRVHFEDGPSCEYQLLATENFRTDQWLWSWGARDMYPEPLLRVGDQLRGIGERDGIPELEQEIGSREDHLVMARCLAAAGLGHADGFLGLDADGGRVWVLGFLPEREAHAGPDVLRVVGTYTALLTMLPVPHRGTLVHYLEAHGFHCEGSERELRAITEDGQWLAAEFDAHGRFRSSKCSATATPIPHPSPPEELDVYHLFELVLVECLKDGQLDETERHVLGELRQVLRPSEEVYQAAFQGALKRIAAGEGGDHVPMEPTLLFERLYLQALADGVLTDDEQRILQRVAELLSITPEEFRAILAHIRKTA